jgi:transposase InsO family protein
MVAFIDAHRRAFGVEPICAQLPIAPSTYYLHKRQAAEPSRRSARAQRDATLRDQITQVHRRNRSVYGGRKVWQQLQLDGVDVARCTVERLMRGLGLHGVTRGRRWVRTTIPDAHGAAPVDRVERQFTATRPNQLWVSDFTYVHTTHGFVYVAFVVDVFARRIVGWRAAATMTTDLVLDALEQAIHQRGPTALGTLVHHSDRGSQYLAMRYTDRLDAAGIAPSVGSRGDAYDNALAESVIGLFKTEEIHRRRTWSSLEAVEYATLSWVHWFNTQRLHSALGYLPPAVYEARYDQHAAVA